MGALCLALVLAVLGVLLPAGAASAHARLQAVEPVPSSVLVAPPSQVVLRFDDRVEVDFGSIEVIGPGGARIDEGGTHYLGNDQTVGLSLPDNLRDGSYVVAWRVISDDGHPVHGAFVFSVGDARDGAAAARLARALAGQSASGVAGGLFWLDRTLVFAALLVLVGLSTLVLWVWPEGGRDRRVRRLLGGSFVLLAVATVVSIALQGVEAAALPLGDVVRPSLFSEVLGTHFGRVALARLALLVPEGVGLLWQAAVPRGATTPRPRRPLLATIGVSAVGLGLLLTPGLAGHAASGVAPVWGLVFDLTHLAGAALWIGGLTLLGVLYLRRPATTPPAAVTTARTVSNGIFAGVVLLVASGVAQAVRQVGSLYALFHTDYGLLLCAKVGAVALLVALGAWSRWRLHGRLFGPPTPAPPPGRRFGAALLAELAGGLCVLGLSAVLVNATPARVAASQPFVRSFTAGTLQVNVVVSPATTGPDNQLHVYVLSPDGTPRAVVGVEGSLALPAERLGPTPLPLVVAGPGHYRDGRLDLAVAGDWVMRIDVQTDGAHHREFDTVLPVH